MARIIVLVLGLRLRSIRFVVPDHAPGIHVFLVSGIEDVDGRVIGERKRRRASDGYVRP